MLRCNFKGQLLLQQSQRPTDQTPPRANIFNSCRGIVRHDMQTAIYLLPYLVLDAVCHGTEEAQCGITEEILTVLDAAVSENSAAAIHGINSRQSEVCIQAVFTLLDNLGQRVDDVEQEIALAQSLQSSNSKQQASKLKNQNTNTSVNSDQVLMQCKYVSELLAAIPKEELKALSAKKVKIDKDLAKLKEGTAALRKLTAGLSEEA